MSFSCSVDTPFVGRCSADRGVKFDKIRDLTILATAFEVYLLRGWKEGGGGGLRSMDPKTKRKLRGE